MNSEHAETTDRVDALVSVHMVHDLVLDDGRTIKQHNLERRHQFAIGELVEVKFDAWFGGGACWKVHARLWVVRQYRDCDGSPLYVLSRWKDPEFAKSVHAVDCGHGEDSMSRVEITDELLYGKDALEWSES